MSPLRRATTLSEHPDAGGGPWHLGIAPSAVRAIRERLPEAVGAAVVEFVTGALLANSRRVGHPLRRELAGTWSARRGTYRILYEPDDSTRTVHVLRVEHRGTVYRSR